MSVRIRFWVRLLVAVFAWLPFSTCQQSFVPYGQMLASAGQNSQQQWADYLARRQTLQAQAKQILGAETARESAPNCPSATTTYDLNLCYQRQTQITAASLSSLDTIIRELLAPPPRSPVSGQISPAVAGPGPAVPALAPQQLIAEFSHVEQTWDQYRDAACTAAGHQFHGGTGGSGIQGECELRLTRDHIRELNLIYGAVLHL